MKTLKSYQKRCFYNKLERNQVIEIVHRLIHSMDEVERDLWKSADPTSLLKQGHIKSVSQDHVQKVFQYLQGWRLCSLPGQPAPGLATLTVKACVLVLTQSLLCFSLHPSPLVLSLGTLKSLSPSSLHSLFRHLYTLMQRGWVCCHWHQVMGTIMHHGHPVPANLAQNCYLLEKYTHCIGLYFCQRDIC